MKTIGQKRIEQGGVEFALRGDDYIAKTEIDLQGPWAARLEIFAKPWGSGIEFRCSGELRGDLDHPSLPYFLVRSKEPVATILRKLKANDQGEALKWRVNESDLESAIRDLTEEIEALA